MMSRGTVVRSATRALRVPAPVRLAIPDAIALLDGGVAEGLRQMALPGAGRAEEERVFALLDEAAGGQLVDERPIHLLVEIEVEAVERAIGIAEARLLGAPLEQPVLPAQELVTDERGDEVERGQAFRLRLAESGLQHAGHAREAELTERAIEFDKCHGVSPVVRSMRSRYKVSCRINGSIWRSVSGRGGRRSR